MNNQYLIPIVFALCSSGSFAQTSTRAPKFFEVDVNDDGAITQSELVQAGINISLTTADKDKNGTLSLGEYEAEVKSPEGE